MAVRVSTELAPAVVARVAAWSFDRLEGLHAHALAMRACRAEDACPELARAYQDAIETQRAHLATVTTEDVPFSRALAIANPQLFAWTEAWCPREPRKKRVRHLETTLYRYLARAVGRTEPCDAWAGVAEGTWGENARSQIKVEATSRTYRFSPDLRPFEEILRALASRPQYRRAGPWRLNPTLHRTSPQTWELVARDGERRLRRREITSSDEGDAVMIALALAPPSSIDELLERAQSQTHLPRADLAEVLDAYIDAGILTGGLALPPQFEDPWNALQAAAAKLDDDHRSVWSAAIESLAEYASDLVVSMEAAPVAKLISVLESADQVITALAKTFDVTLATRPRTPFRCDLGAPLRLVLGPAMRARLQATVDEYERCQTFVLPAAALRRELASEIAAFCGSGRPLAAAIELPTLRSVTPPSTWQALLTRVEPSRELIARVADWERLLEVTSDEVTCNVRGEPEMRGAFGTLMLGLRRCRDDAPGLMVFGIMDEVAPVCARYHGLLGASIIAWHRECIARIEQECGVEVADLLADCVTSPNTLARPQFSARVFDLWGATPGAESLLGAELLRDSTAGSLVLRMPSSERLLVLSPFSSSDVGAADVVAETLLRSSFRDAPVAQFRAVSLPVDGEVIAPRFTPRVRLPCGAVIRPRRTVITGDELAALLAGIGAQRYAVWCRLAESHRWPAYVTVQRDSGGMLAMPTTSPLALEAVLEGARSSTTMLIVQELDEPWLQLPDGSRHVVELGVPFARTRHAWSQHDSRTRERTWLQFDVALGDADAARRALETIAPIVGDFFFMRKPPGLRIRVDCQVPREIVAADCLAALASLERLRIIRDVQVGRYEPETTLFGGAAAMAHIHTFFCADTRAWLALVNESQMIDHALPTAALEELFRELLDPAEVWDAWVSYQRLLPAPELASAPPPLVGLDELETLATPSQRDVMRTYRRAAHQLADGLRDLARRGRLGCGLRTILPFIALFTFHRWGVRGDFQARIAAVLVSRHDPRPWLREETS